MLFKLVLKFALSFLLLASNSLVFAAAKKEAVITFTCEEILSYVKGSVSSNELAGYPARVKRYVVAGLLQHYLADVHSLYFRGHQQPFYSPNESFRNLAQQLLDADVNARQVIYKKLQSTPVRGPRGSVEAISFPTNPGDLTLMAKDIEGVIAENQLITDSARDLYFTLLLLNHTREEGANVQLSLVNEPNKVITATFEGAYEMGSNRLRFKVKGATNDLAVYAKNINSLSLLTP